MNERKVDLFILESLWDEKLSSETSVRPFFESLSRLYDIKYVYKTFHSEENIRYFIEESKRQKLSCQNYYIAAHGSRKYFSSYTRNLKIKNPLCYSMSKKKGYTLIHTKTLSQT